MRFRDPLDDLFRDRSHVRVLRALTLLPGTTASARTLAARAGVSHPTASKVLASLVDVGVVGVERRPRLSLFRLNLDHVLADTVVDLFRREGAMYDGLLDALRAALAPARSKIREAYVFGSVAEGRSSPTSDIDLAITCRAADRSAVNDVAERAAEAIHRRFGNRLNVLLEGRSADSLRRSRDGQGRLWRRIAREGLGVTPRSGVRR